MLNAQTYFSSLFTSIPVASSVFTDPAAQAHEQGSARNHLELKE
jgi:hypothetical protein